MPGPAAQGSRPDRELARARGFGDKGGMNMHTALRLSATVLAICIAALVADLAIYFLHIPVPAKFKTVLDVLAFVWPLVMVFFGTYLRKVQRAAAESRSPSA